MGTQKWNETCRICAVGRVTFSFAVGTYSSTNRIARKPKPNPKINFALLMLRKHTQAAFVSSHSHSYENWRSCFLLRFIEFRSLEIYISNRVIEFYNRFNSMFILSISNSWRTRVSSPSRNVFGFKKLLFFFPSFRLCCRFQILSTQQTRTRTHTLFVCRNADVFIYMTVSDSYSVSKLTNARPNTLQRIFPNTVRNSFSTSLLVCNAVLLHLFTYSIGKTTVVVECRAWGNPRYYSGKFRIGFNFLLRRVKYSRLILRILLAL